MGQSAEAVLSVWRDIKRRAGGGAAGFLPVTNPMAALCAPGAYEPVTCEDADCDAWGDQRSDKKRCPRVPWRCDEPADEGQRADGDGGRLPFRSRRGDEERSGSDQYERSLAIEMPRSYPCLPPVGSIPPRTVRRRAQPRKAPCAWWASPLELIASRAAVSPTTRLIWQTASLRQLSARESRWL